MRSGLMKMYHAEGVGLSCCCSCCTLWCLRMGHVVCMSTFDCLVSRPWMSAPDNKPSRAGGAHRSQPVLTWVYGPRLSLLSVQCGRSSPSRSTFSSAPSFPSLYRRYPLRCPPSPSCVRTILIHASSGSRQCTAPRVLLLLLLLLQGTPSPQAPAEFIASEGCGPSLSLPSCATTHGHAACSGFGGTRRPPPPVAAGEILALIQWHSITTVVCRHADRVPDSNHVPGCRHGGRGCPPHPASDDTDDTAREERLRLTYGTIERWRRGGEAPRSCYAGRIAWGGRVFDVPVGGAAGACKLWMES